MSFRPYAIMLNKESISDLNLKQLKTGEKRWIGTMLGSSTTLLFKNVEKSDQLLVLVCKK